MYKKIMSKENRLFFNIMLKNKSDLIYIIIFNILCLILNIIEPLFAQRIVDISFHINDLNELLVPAFFWLGIFVTRYILLYFNHKITLIYELKITKKIKLYVFNIILKKVMTFFKNNSAGYIVSKCNLDILNLKGMMLSNIIIGILSFFEIIIMIILMFNISVSLTMIAIILEIIILYIQFSFPLKKLYKEHNESLANVDKIFQDILDCIKLIKSANSYNYESQYFNKVLTEYFQKRYDRDHFDIIRNNITSFCINFIYPAIIIISGIFIYYHLITIGAVMAFLMYFQKINALFNNAFAMIPLFKMAEVSAERLYKLLTIPNEFNNLKSPESTFNLKGKIIFKDVNFSYDNKKILNNLSMTIYPNKINAIVGRSGTGKSTIINLLMGFIKADTGKIYINDNQLFVNQDIQNIRSKIAFLSQESILFQRTIKENIEYHLNNNNINIRQVLDAVYAKDFIDNLPNRMQTLIENNSNNLSGGEKQRLCLARELLKNADVYILDESTSSLDTLSEKIILKSIKKIAENSTVIIITHKLANIKEADIIYVMDDGHICEYGQHQELMHKRGLYYNLYKQQN